MRVVNVTPDPRHFAYGSPDTAGRTIASGDKSPELPLERLFNPVFQKDLDAGIVQLQLEKPDCAFLEKMLEQADRPIKVTRRTPVKKKKAAKLPPKADIPSVPNLAPPKRVVPPPSRRITGEDVQSGKVSLGELQRQNAAVPDTPSAGSPVTPESKATLDDIAGMGRGPLGAALIDGLPAGESDGKS